MLTILRVVWYFCLKLLDLWPIIFLMCIVRWPEFSCNWIPGTVTFYRSILDICWICLLQRYKNIILFKKIQFSHLQIRTPWNYYVKNSHPLKQFPSISSPHHFCNIAQLKTMWNRKCPEMLILVFICSKGQCSFHLLPLLWVWNVMLLCNRAIGLYKCSFLAIKT